MSKIYARRVHLNPTQGQGNIIPCIEVHNSSLINELHKNVSRVIRYDENIWKWNRGNLPYFKRFKEFFSTNINMCIL